MAEVSVHSIGVGYEICHAVGLEKPVLCVYEPGSNVSAMVLGFVVSVESGGYVSKKVENTG